MSTDPSPAWILRHVIGLALAGAILYGLYLAWGESRGWLRGTWFTEMRHLVAAVAVAAALWLGEKIWSVVNRALSSDRPDSHP